MSYQFLLLKECRQILHTTGRACCRAGIHCWSARNPVRTGLIKDIKVQVNKQKPNPDSYRDTSSRDEVDSDKMPIAPTFHLPAIFLLAVVI